MYTYHFAVLRQPSKKARLVTIRFDRYNPSNQTQSMNKLIIASKSTEPVETEAGRPVHIADSTEELISYLKATAGDSLDELHISGIAVDESVLFEALRVLKPNCKVVIENSIPTRSAGQLLDGDLQIAGFMNSMVAKDPSTGVRFAVATKPDVAVGAAAKVNIGQDSSAKWEMSALDLAEGDLVDEKDLLDDGLDTTKIPGGCGDAPAAEGGKKRACKNCSCGLAEQEAAGIVAGAPKTVEEKITKSSSCGNCAKGDAFRCAGCPFLGKPAFEPGQERVMLTSIDDI